MKKKEIPETNSPQTSSPYLYEIAERLKTKHASVMIGSGFSKNAEGNEKTKYFPSWIDLGNKFLDKLNEGCSSKKKKEFLNPIKLASELESTFGRPTLNSIIRASIPDNEFQPSELHKKLLILPWTDVFTTNYDTLLERTAENIFQYRYETIVNKEDLVWSTKPRIVKLHGSFPSTRPFIITEEDFRTYPANYAPFVNTVQQSLLENTLCLIGFSGDDPNFLSWIGWIRDNLGKENSPKMYLIGILDLSTGQRKLLEDRNINIIDISFYSKDHYEALSKLLDFLQDYCQNEEKQNWPSEEHIEISSSLGDIQPQIEKAIKVWRKTREEYPNWLILPNSRREILKQNTLYQTPIYYIDKIKKPLDIIILYEFNWRVDKSLYPILSDYANSFRSVIDKYNPYPDKIQISNSIVPNDSDNIDWEKISIYWIELHLSLLSFYRHDGMDNDWDLISKRLEAIKKYLSSEQNAKYHYEKCLKKMFALDISGVREEIKLWAGNFSLPYWEAKKAGLLAEIGELDEARSILETSLKQVRNSLFFNPVRDDYLDISYEGYILFLLRYVQNSLEFSSHSLKEDNKWEEHQRRWKIIKEYECDPWGELEKFESSFKIKPPPYKSIEKEYDFNLGSQITHTKYGNDEYSLTAFSYINFIESTGIPLRLPGMSFFKNTTNKVVERIADFSPELALITFIRVGDEKNMDALFSRRALTKLSQENTDKLSNLFLDILNNIIIEFKDGNSFFNRNFAVNLAIILPQILARLCVKNSYEINLKILQFAKSVYSSKKKDNYEKISLLMRNLINSFSNEEQQELFHVFLEFPIIPDSQILKYPDPFLFIDIENKNEIKHHVNMDLINKLFISDYNYVNADDQQISSDIRKKYITRLVVLWSYDQLNNDQIKLFADILWSKRKSNGFPADTNYYEFIFLKFPYPQTIDIPPLQLLKKYINQSNVSFRNPHHLNSGVDMTGGRSSEIYNIIGTFNKDISYQWDNESINNLLAKVIYWWNEDKKNLIENEKIPYISSISDEFKARFNKMISIFICVFAPNIEMIDKRYRNDIDLLLKELPKYKMGDLAARVSFLKLFPDNERDILTCIENALLSQEEEKMLDALNSIVVLLRQNNENVCILISLISQIIKIRSGKCFDRVLDIASIIVRLHSNYLTETIIDEINIGLKYILNESEINDEDDNEHIHKKMICRIEGIKLVLSLKKYFILNTLEIPEYMREWEERCLDKNQFSEIRNAWKNNE
jgi:hypothetical protein